MTIQNPAVQIILCKMPEKSKKILICSAFTGNKHEYELPVSLPLSDSKSRVWILPRPSCMTLNISAKLLYLSFTSEVG